jgi:hypothetical protein
MVTAATIPPGEHVPHADQRVMLHGVPWSHYEVMLALKGDASVPRMSYLQGSLELMNPSLSHEQIKSTIGRLIETYALEVGSSSEATARGRSGARRRKQAPSPMSAT